MRVPDWLAMLEQDSGVGKKVVVLKMFNKRAFMGLALCLPLVGGTAFAENFRLDSVDFVSSGGRTDIILHTGSILPVQKVMVSDEKVILDVDNVNADETVRTNFSGASNVSNVIFKPLGEHKIRLIIRGQNLGAPSVAFNSPVAHDVGHFMDRLPETTASGMRTLQDQGMQSAALSTADRGIETAAVDNAPLENGFTSEMPASAPIQPTSDPSLKAAQQGAPVLPITSAGQTLPQGADTGLNRFFNTAAAGGLDKFLPYGLLGLLLLGAGAFVHNRLNRIDDEPNLEDLIEEQQQGKKISFRDMADAYRQQNDVAQTTGKNTKATKPQPELKANASQPQAPALRKQQAQDQLIGLGSLRQNAAPAGGNSPANRQAAYLESLMEAANTAPAVKPTAAPQKALNQYQQAAKPVAAPKNNPAKPQAKPKNRALADQKMAEETRRQKTQQGDVQDSMQALIQQALAARGGNAAAPQAQKAQFPQVSRQAAKPAMNAAQGKMPTASNPRPQAPKPAIAGGQDLPATNPQVLDFLRNVAELMDQDGKPEIARSIQRNLESL